MIVDISKFKNCKVLVVGDLMIDEYLWGEVDRISPEAPVQIVSVKKEDYTLGGSGNVANNLVALGAKVLFAGVTGTGKNAEFLLKKFKDLGVDTSGIVQDPDRQTTIKTRIIAENQHILRIDRETKKNISDKTSNLLSDFIEEKLKDIDVVLISDYGKGVITEKLLERIVKAAAMHNKPAIADPVGFDYSRYSHVYMLTPNKKEASLASGIEIVNQSTLFKAGAMLLEIVHMDKLLITCGKDGMALFEKNKKPYIISSRALQVYDVSGAGDTVLSVIGLALASGASVKKAAILANYAAGIVVGKVGTATVSKEELEALINPNKENIMSKHTSLEQLDKIVSELKKNGQKIVLTNGCFDLLHAGHIILFSASKQLGDVLVVAVNDDESVNALKGEGRPVIKLKERLRILSALDSIDYVIVFSSDELTKVITCIQPDVLAKGTNYQFTEVVGRNVVEKAGGRIALIPITENISSTSIINNIKSNKSIKLKFKTKS